MPCENTLAEIILVIDETECLSDYTYKKMSCGKNVGTPHIFKEFAVGKKIDYLAALGFRDLLNLLSVEDREEEFLLYLEWKAMTESLRKYLGKEEKSEDSGRYKIAEVESFDASVTVKMLVTPPYGMPEITPYTDSGNAN